MNRQRRRHQNRQRINREDGEIEESTEKMERSKNRQRIAREDGEIEPGGGREKRGFRMKPDEGEREKYRGGQIKR